MWTQLKTRLRHFAEDTRGTVAVEAAIVLPLLLWSYMAMYIFFDAYQTRSSTEKAAFTISDILSRETNAIDTTYLANMRTLFDLMSESDSASGLRVSVIRWSVVSDDYELQWSHTQGAFASLDDEGLNAIENRLPNMADGETLILVETYSTYEPSLKVGMDDLTITTFIFTRPRFAPQLVWSS
ncbi:pilus assembly protein [Shimia sp. SDUM112013]|uniref:TadE/TadG family type IV pilus assembly protein n=1 Tax=Shimia sp. SDUM112013 TaxID=3136160 RepID=UPI0032EBD9AC